MLEQRGACLRPAGSMQWVCDRSAPLSVTPRWATAFAPASVGNVAICFSVSALGDRVTVSRTEAKGVTITDGVGVAGNLPTDPAQTTAGRALAMQEALHPGFGFEMRIDKGIPLGSGLGGSAASAVGAVVAANALLPQPRSKLEPLKYAMHGEAVASGPLHVDNISPSLFGGLVLTVGIASAREADSGTGRNTRPNRAPAHVSLDAAGTRDLKAQRRAVGFRVADGKPRRCYTSDLDMI